jgi:hypothetical protein
LHGAHGHAINAKDELSFKRVPARGVQAECQGLAFGAPILRAKLSERHRPAMA